MHHRLIMVQFVSTRVSLFSILWVPVLSVHLNLSARPCRACLLFIWPKKSFTSPAILRNGGEICATVLKLNQYLAWNCLRPDSCRRRRPGISNKIHILQLQLIQRPSSPCSHSTEEEEKISPYHRQPARASCVVLSANRFFPWGWANYMLLKVSQAFNSFRPMRVCLRCRYQLLLRQCWHLHNQFGWDCFRLHCALIGFMRQRRLSSQRNSIKTMMMKRCLCT